jgi:hypothetical protein
MKKTLNVTAITNELRGQSAFFASSTNRESTPTMTEHERTDERTNERAYARTDERAHERTEKSAA